MMVWSKVSRGPFSATSRGRKFTYLSRIDYSVDVRTRVGPTQLLSRSKSQKFIQSALIQVCRLPEAHALRYTAHTLRAGDLITRLDEKSWPMMSSSVSGGSCALGKHVRLFVTLRALYNCPHYRALTT